MKTGAAGRVPGAIALNYNNPPSSDLVSPLSLAPLITYIFPPKPWEDEDMCHLLLLFSLLSNGYTGLERWWGFIWIYGVATQTMGAERFCGVGLLDGLVVLRF